MKLPLSEYPVDGSSAEGSWALLECLAQAGRSDKESQEEAGEGSDEKDEKKDENEDGVSAMLKPSRRRKENPGTGASVSRGGFYRTI